MRLPCPCRPCSWVEGCGPGSGGDEPRAQRERTERWGPRERWVFGQNPREVGVERYLHLQACQVLLFWNHRTPRLGRTVPLKDRSWPFPEARAGDAKACAASGVPVGLGWCQVALPTHPGWHWSPAQLPHQRGSAAPTDPLPGLQAPGNASPPLPALPPAGSTKRIQSQEPGQVHRGGQHVGLGAPASFPVLDSEDSWPLHPHRAPTYSSHTCAHTCRHSLHTQLTHAHT